MGDEAVLDVEHLELVVLRDLLRDAGTNLAQEPVGEELLGRRNAAVRALQVAHVRELAD
jgi:hypothetical protein